MENRAGSIVVESNSLFNEPQVKNFPWAVTAPFLRDPQNRWISDFVESDRHSFQVIPQAGPEISWHTKKLPRTGLSEWRQFAKTACSALEFAEANQGGVITVFPQLAAATASRKKFKRLDVPIVAWFFNTTFERNARSLLGRKTLPAVDRFVVHSTVEIEAYARELSLPHSRFEFVPAQYGATVDESDENAEEPFVFATGSGFRDYGTFFDAMAKLDMPAKVVAGPRVLAGLTPPPNVEILDGVSIDEIRRYIRQARVNVIPMESGGLTAGLLTIVLTFRHGRGLVITDRPGIDDYVHADQDSLLVPMHDASSMAAAIEAMYEDADLRSRLGAAADEFATANCTDQAAGRSLLRILDEVTIGR